MTDFLLKFPSKPTAEQFGVILGYASVDPDTGAVTPTLATMTFALAVIGEHFYPTGNTIEGPMGPMPEMAGDGNWWVMIRALVPIPVPPEAAPFIVWHSALVDEQGDPVPRPSGQEYPQNQWA